MCIRDRPIIAPIFNPGITKKGTFIVFSFTFNCNIICLVTFLLRTPVTPITPVSYTHLDVYKRQLYNTGLYAKHHLILFEFTAVIGRHRKNYPC